MIWQKKGDERAELSIKDIDLNRVGLIEKRLTHLESINKAIDRCFRTTNLQLKDNALDELKKEAQEDKEYSFFVKKLLIDHGIL